MHLNACLRKKTSVFARVGFRLFDSLIGESKVGRADIPVLEHVPSTSVQYTTVHIGK